VTPAPDESAHYDARWGYRQFDARRYEARRYGGAVRRWNHWLLERTLARGLAAVPRGGVVLDAPCGTGILADFLRGRGLRVLGMDISPAMLGVATTRRPAVGHVRADLEALPLKPGSVDAVVSTRFLMHLPPELRPRMLAGLARVSRGPVVATVCHPYTVKSFGRAVRRAFGGKAKRSPRLTRRELEREVREAGLQLDACLPVLPLLSEVWVIVVRTVPGAQ
jgi:ubiquinone/menaquinone biosynthesis C-methylase UbiE